MSKGFRICTTGANELPDTLRHWYAARAKEIGDWLDTRHNYGGLIIADYTPAADAYSSGRMVYSAEDKKGRKIRKVHLTTIYGTTLHYSPEIQAEEAWRNRDVR